MYDYSDQIVKAALAGTSVVLDGKTFDFTTYDLEARGGMCNRFFCFLWRVLIYNALFECLINYLVVL